MRAIVEHVLKSRRLPAPDYARVIRQQCELTQAQIAQEVGVSRPTISRWESGLRRPCGEQRIAYVELLGELQREVLEGGPGHPVPPQD